MRWQAELAETEEILWEGRPAPRCYTFRHWRHSIVGFIFLVICSYWQVLGLEMAETYELPWLVWLPLPFVLIGLYFSVGHLLQARLEWNGVFYAVSDRRLLVQRGLRQRQSQSLDLSEITYFSLHRQGDELGTLYVHKGLEKKLILHCIEHPQLVTNLLEEAMGDKAHPPQPEKPE
jgi:hypothetical protein